MNNLLLTDTFLPRIGGRENYYHNLFTHLPDDDKIVIITPDKTGNWQDFDQKYSFPIYRVDKILSKHWTTLGRPGKIKWSGLLTNICWWYEIDIIHCGLVIPDGLSGWLLNQTLGKPYIIYAHGKEILEYENNPKDSQYMQLVLKSASRVICNSNYTGEIIQKVGVSSEKIITILPGINPQQWLREINADELNQIKQKYGLSDQSIILTVGRLIERKGHDKVIEAMPKILAAFPDTIYLIVGEGKERSRLENLTIKLGLEKNIIFVGEVDEKDLLAYYKIATIFAMISRQPVGSHEVEGFGIVYLEANISGLPVIGGKSGGVPEAILEGKTGYLVDPFSSEEVGKSMINLLKNPQLRQKMAYEGRQRAINELSWHNQGQILAKVNQEVAQENKSYSFIKTVTKTLPFLLEKNRLI